MTDPVLFFCYFFKFLSVIGSAETKLNFTKLMVSRDLRRSTVTNQIAFDQPDLHSTPEFEGTMDCRCQVLVSKLEPLDTITFT